MQKLQREWTIPYIPHEKQRPFHEDRYKYRFRLISGGTGSGKTIAGVWEMLSYLLDDNPGSVGYIFEPTYGMVRRNLIPKFQRLLGLPIEANYAVREFHRTDNRIEFKNESQLWFGGLDQPEMAEGAEIDFIQVDEARLVRRFEEAWQSILRRLRGSVPGKYHTGAYVTTTPNAPFSFLHAFFENSKTRNPQSKVYRMSIYDNKYLTREQILTIEQSHTGGNAERFIFGRFANVGAGTIPFDSTIHELTTVDMKRIKEVIYGVDFGWTNPSAIICVGFDGDGRAYVLDEYYQNRIQPEVLACEAKNMVARWGKGRFYCDRSEPASIEMLRREGLSAYADSTKREDGIHELSGRFIIAGDGKPRIYIHTSCVNTIQELITYDDQVKENDHAVDALRYVVMGSQRPTAGVARSRW